MTNSTSLNVSGNSEDETVISKRKIGNSKENPGNSSDTPTQSMTQLLPFYKND